MKAYLNSVSPPSNLTNKKDSFTPSAHDSTPEYYSPFKTIINKKNDDTPKHIFERNN